MLGTPSATFGDRLHFGFAAEGEETIDKNSRSGVEEKTASVFNQLGRSLPLIRSETLSEEKSFAKRQAVSLNLISKKRISDFITKVSS